MKLEWGPYKHFPYERQLAVREASALIGSDIVVCPNGDVCIPTSSLEDAQQLTYFSAAQVNGRRTETVQQQLESSFAPSRKRQSTRYSVHGLHEYKGKFNPQVARSLINILKNSKNGLLFDPFCGSGTTLVEAAHLGFRSFGTDLNPLAVYISNAKLRALVTPAAGLNSALERILARTARGGLIDLSGPRGAYLSSWFEPPILAEIEHARQAISSEESQYVPFFMTIASNLLREFSLQDPADLRIRRRITAGIKGSFASAFAAMAEAQIAKIAATQSLIGQTVRIGQAKLRDNRSITWHAMGGKADIAITSPPYATALPYIDTQRLSLVWMSLISPSQISSVDASLIGSREMTTSEKRVRLDDLLVNSSSLPASEADFCAELQRALGQSDGFRRQLTPVLLYRYFTEMQKTFKAVKDCLRSGAPFALIVGHNHTVLGGTRFEINTPEHLVSLAESVGWMKEEVTQLQSYQRYGLNMSNAVKAETLIVLRKP